MTNTHDNCNKIYKAIIQYCQSIFHLYEKKAFIMSIIKNCLSLINNALNIQKNIIFSDQNGAGREVVK
ncbi:hypothetical protein OkiPb00131_42760 [Escherichia coli]